MWKACACMQTGGVQCMHGEGGGYAGAVCMEGQSIGRRRLVLTLEFAHLHDPPHGLPTPAVPTWHTNVSMCAGTTTRPAE